MIRLTHLIRLRLLFQHRKWSDIPAAIDTLGREIDAPDQDSPGAHPLQTDTWQTHLQLHYLLYRALWHGRSGDDAATKSLLKKVYLVMDQAADAGIFALIRANGGVLKVSQSAWMMLMIVSYSRRR